MKGPPTFLSAQREPGAVTGDPADIARKRGRDCGHVTELPCYMVGGLKIAHASINDKLAANGESGFVRRKENRRFRDFRRLAETPSWYLLL